MTVANVEMFYVALERVVETAVDTELYEDTAENAAHVVKEFLEGFVDREVIVLVE